MCGGDEHFGGDPVEVAVEWDWDGVVVDFLEGVVLPASLLPV